MRQPHPINIRFIDHVVLRVNDLEGMIEFYCEVLGCRLERGPGKGNWPSCRPDRL
ncbi:MAG: VOC family protein [Gammaproteobacteria bacterium]